MNFVSQGGIIFLDNFNFNNIANLTKVIENVSISEVSICSKQEKIHVERSITAVVFRFFGSRYKVSPMMWDSNPRVLLV